MHLWLPDQYFGAIMARGVTSLCAVFGADLGSSPSTLSKNFGSLVKRSIRLLIVANGPDVPRLFSNQPRKRKWTRWPLMVNRTAHSRRIRLMLLYLLWLMWLHGSKTRWIVRIAVPQISGEGRIGIHRALKTHRNRPVQRFGEAP